MFRRLLTLLVALPLLLPQGVCVCDFMRSCEACEDCAVSVEPEKPSCGCHKHKQAQAVQDDDLEIAKGHTCHKSLPTEKQDNHVPGCPAKEGTAVWKADTAPAPVTFSLGLVGLLNYLELPVTTFTVSAPTIHLAASGRPIYLTFLTLRI